MKKIYLFLIQTLVVLCFFFAMSCEKPKNNQPPTCSIANPANNAQFYLDESISVTVIAKDQDGKITEVQLYVDDAIHSTKTTSPYNFTINAGTLSPGTHTLKAVTKDNEGATGEFSAVIEILSKGNKAPACIIMYPVNNAEFNTDESILVTVVAEDEDGYIAEVQLYVDNVGHSIKTSYPYNFTINPGELSSGTHTLRAVAKDNDGANGESTVVIEINQPNIGIESPDFVTFSDERIPGSWQATAWYVDNYVGYDDIYSLRTTTNNTAVVANKTGTSNINFVEFYLKGSGTVYFYMDGSISKVCALENNWVKYGFYFEEGLHTFEWKFSKGIEVNLDAIRFKKETELAVGIYYKGEIIAYLDNTNQHGLIAAPYDLSEAQWYKSYMVTGATGTTVGTGQSNTTQIVQAQGLGFYAAKLCDDLVLNSYSDWFLPSKDELNFLYQNRNLIGGFTVYYYWSSSEYDAYFAWSQNFSDGIQYFNGNKFSSIWGVRAVRTF